MAFRFLKGRVVHGTKPGPKPYLSACEEKELSSFLKTCSDIGYGKTRRDVMCIAQSVAVDKCVLKGSKISEGWWRRFLLRQPDLSLRRGDTTAHVRMNAVNSETMKQYFSLLNDVMSEYELHSKPSQIYNVDESGIPFDPRPPNVVTTKGTKKVRYRASGRKGQVTIVGCASASGHALPPMVIFDAQKLNPAWTEGEFPGTKYGLSSNGWINTELFEAWLSEHFLEHAVSARPLLLLLDGHSTHYQPELLRLAKQHDVIMLCLPPHTSHESQPLDCGVFGPLKSHWSNVCHTYLQQHPGRVVTRFQFSALFSKAWSMAVSPVNIIAGFRTCGVYPYNPLAIRVPDVQQTSEVDQGSSSVVPTSCSLPPDVGVSHSDSLCDGSATLSCGVVQSMCDSVNRDGGASVCSTSSVENETTVTFTAEQEQRFQIRYEEGFNIFTDRLYVKWLELHHPEVLPADCSSRPSANDEFTLADYFSSVTPAISLECTEVVQQSPTASQSPRDMEENPQDDSPVSKYLTLPPGASPSIPKTMPRARLLTSTDAMAQMEEKERKKKQALEEKERRKIEREDRKRQREEEQKRKAEERERKSKERAKKVKQAVENKNKKKSRNATLETQKANTSAPILSADENEAGPSCLKEPSRKKPRRDALPSSTDSEIDFNVCCMCFGTYSEDVANGDGRDWIECACGRWLHEDCAEDCLLNKDGKEMFCHSCI